jgi:hypothetical protein
MAPPLNRSWFDQLIDDDGSGTVGTVWNKTQVDGLLDTIDASLAGLVDKSGTAAANQLATFADADTIKGEPTLLATGGDLTLQKTTPRIVLDYAGATTKSRVVGPFADVVTLTQNANHNGTAWVQDDASKRALLVTLGSGVLTVQAIPAGGGALDALLQLNAAGVLQLLKGQFFFPPTQNPSADPNTLDDYHEGTWLPRITADGGASGQVYLKQFGLYTKVGRLVTLEFEVQLTTKGTLNGAVFLSNIPYLTAIAGASCAIVADNLANSNITNPLTWSLGGPGWDAGYLRVNLPQNYLVGSDLTDSTRFLGSMSYHAMG